MLICVLIFQGVTSFEPIGLPRFRLMLDSFANCPSETRIWAESFAVGIKGKIIIIIISAQKKNSNLFSTIQHETDLIPNERLKKKLCENHHTNRNIHIETSRIKILDLRKRTRIHNKILRYLNLSLGLYDLPDLNMSLRLYNLPDLH